MRLAVRATRHVSSAEHSFKVDQLLVIGVRGGWVGDPSGDHERAINGGAVGTVDAEGGRFDKGYAGAREGAGNNIGVAELGFNIDNVLA